MQSFSEIQLTCQHSQPPTAQSATHKLRIIRIYKLSSAIFVLRSDGKATCGSSLRKGSLKRLQQILNIVVWSSWSCHYLGTMSDLSILYATLLPKCKLKDECDIFSYDNLVACQSIIHRLVFSRKGRTYRPHSRVRPSFRAELSLKFSAAWEWSLSFKWQDLPNEKRV